SLVSCEGLSFCRAQFFGSCWVVAIRNWDCHQIACGGIGPRIQPARLKYSNHLGPGLTIQDTCRFDPNFLLPNRELRRKLLRRDTRISSDQIADQKGVKTPPALHLAPEIPFEIIPKLRVAVSRRFKYGVARAFHRYGGRFGLR